MQTKVMKNLLFVLLLCLLSTAAGAQEVYNSSGKGKPGYKKTKKITGYDPDKLIVGGGLNANFGSGYLSLGISPIVGYRLTNRLSAGVGVGYQYYREPDIYTTDPMNPTKNFYNKMNIVYPSLWSRFIVYQNFFVDANFEYDIINFKGSKLGLDPSNNIIVVDNKITVTAPCLLLGVGIKQPLSGRVSFFGEVMYDVLQQKYSPYLGRPVFRAGIAAGF